MILEGPSQLSIAWRSINPGDGMLISIQYPTLSLCIRAIRLTGFIPLGFAENPMLRRNGTSFELDSTA